MRKYSVPFYYVVWVDAEAQDEQEAYDLASAVPIVVSAQKVETGERVEVDFSYAGDTYEYKEEEA